MKLECANERPAQHCCAESEGPRRGLMMNVAPGGTGAAIPDAHDAYRPNPESACMHHPGWHQRDDGGQRIDGSLGLAPRSTVCVDIGGYID